MNDVPTFVTFKWTPRPGYRSQYGPEQVLTMRSMIARHYEAPHRFVCVTDDAAGLEAVETVPLWPDFADVPSPHGLHNPSCYRRLKLFAPEACALLGVAPGARLINIDLDMVIVGNLQALFDRPDDFIIWGQSDFPKTQWYNGSLWMLRAGTRPQVWTAFNPKTSPKEATRAGKRGSDQGWLSHILGPNESTWSTSEGVYSYRVHLSKRGWTLPENARVIAFHGRVDPWSYEAQQHAWVREAYR